MYAIILLHPEISGCPVFARLIIASVIPLSILFTGCRSSLVFGAWCWLWSKEWEEGGTGIWFLSALVIDSTKHHRRSDICFSLLSVALPNCVYSICCHLMNASIFGIAPRLAPSSARLRMCGRGEWLVHMDWSFL